MTVAAIDTVAEGLWRRLRDVVRTERALAGFAFAPEPAAGAPRRPAPADEAGVDALARDLTLRALAAAADPLNYRVLRALGAEGVAVDDVAGAVALPALAVSERVHALAQVGLAARELEHDAVAATTAGRGVVALVEAIGAALGARWRAARSELG